MERRGVHKNSVTVDDIRVMMTFDLPLNEIIVDFHDNLKSISSGFASFDYEDCGFSPSNVVKVSRLYSLYQKYLLRRHIS